MNAPEHPRLAQVLHEAIDGLEPADRLHAIRTRTQESVMPTLARPWLVAVVGAVVAVAAVVVGVAVLSSGDQNPRTPVAGSPDDTSTAPTASASPTSGTGGTNPNESGSSSPGDGAAGETTVPVYYVTDTAQAGPRLVREFHRVSGDPWVAAAGLLSAAPADDGYRTLWPDLEVTEVTRADGVLVVDVTGEGSAERPANVTEREADLATQQLVYTLQGVTQARLPIQVRRTGADTRVLGVPTDREWTAAPALATLNHVNITSPEQGQVVSGNRLEVTGVANSFEANVVCSLVVAGQDVVTRPFTAEGWMEDKLFPFAGTLPLAGAGTGDVLVRCSTDDPTGGTEGTGPFTDDKLVTVR